MSLWGANSAATADRPEFAKFTAEGDRSADVEGVKASGVDGLIVQNPGWNLIRQGTGPVISVAITNGGTGYANGEAVVFTANTDNLWLATAPTIVDAVATVTTDGAGVITGVTLVSGGSGYTEAPDLTVTTVAGNNAVLVATTGGRSGRITAETLAVVPSMTGGVV